MSKGQILAALPKLPNDDLVAIHALLGSLINDRTAAVGQGATPLQGVIFDALVSRLNRPVRLENLPPKVRARFEHNAANLLAFFDANFTGWDSHKVTQVAFLRFMFGLLTDNMKKFEVKPAPSTLISHMPRMAMAFNDQFPGYLQNRMGGLILRQFRK